MKKRIAASLAEFGFTGTPEEFRTALAEIKAESYPEFTIEELTFTRDEAGTYCQLVRKRLNAPRLTRPFILRALTGLRKNKPRKRARSV